MSCSGDDALEQNDDFDTASVVVVGSIVGIVCIGDDDYYSIEVFEGGLVRAELSFDAADADLDFYLYDAAQVFLDVSNLVSSRENVAGYSNSATTFYVWVRGYQGAAQGSYALSLSIERSPFYAAGLLKGCPADDGLGNTGYLASTQLSSGDEIIAVICGDGLDWYVVSLEAGERLNGPERRRHPRCHFDLHRQ